MGEICRRIEVSERSYCRWRREDGDLYVDQARRLKDPARENTVTTTLSGHAAPSDTGCQESNLADGTNREGRSVAGNPISEFRQNKNL